MHRGGKLAVQTFNVPGLISRGKELPADDATIFTRQFYNIVVHFTRKLRGNIMKQYEVGITLN